MSVKENTVVVVRHGLPLPTLLTVLFVGLKLTGQIDWSWVWVLAPLWIGLAVFFATIIVFLLFAVVFLGLAALFQR